MDQNCTIDFLFLIQRVSRYVDNTKVKISTGQKIVNTLSRIYKPSFKLLLYFNTFFWKMKKEKSGSYFHLLSYANITIRLIRIIARTTEFSPERRFIINVIHLPR